MTCLKKIIPLAIIGKERLLFRWRCLKANKYKKRKQHTYYKYKLDPIKQLTMLWGYWVTCNKSKYQIKYLFKTYKYIFCFYITVVGILCVVRILLKWLFFQFKRVASSSTSTKYCIIGWHQYSKRILNKFRRNQYL